MHCCYSSGGKRTLMPPHKTTIDSHDGDTWVALWESLVGKPRGKATDPLIHAKGSVTLLLQLGREAHVHAPIRDED